MNYGNGMMPDAGAAQGLYQPQALPAAVPPPGMGGTMPMAGIGDQGSPVPGIDMETFKRYLATMPPEERDQFVSSLLEDAEGTRGAIDVQRAKANRLRQASNAAGGPLERGDMFIAANPIGALAGAAGSFQASREQARADTAVDDMAKRRSEALKRMGGMFLS